MKKKIFSNIVILLTVATLMFTTFSAFRNYIPKKSIGLQLYSVRDSIKKDVPGTIAKIGTMGYSFVELAGYGDGKFYGMSPSGFKALCNANNLYILSSHAGQDAPDSTNMKEIMEWWDACIEAHVAAGAKFIVQPSMGRSAYKSLAGLKTYCDYFNAVGEKCNAKGIRFGYHNHDKEFSAKLEGQTMYDFMLANTDPSKVMFQIDLYWAVVGGANPVDYFNKYPGRFELWHIKDKEEIGASGMMNFKAIWAAAPVSGMQYGIVEVEKYNFDQFTSCKMSFDFLNSASYAVMPN
ncbi:MAG: sugar phosphate isomerase [Odoribacter sp.]|nr:sugar phosphate isomerase [Odoribacter sp.]